MLSDVRRSRAERFIAGAAPKDIAAEDGVHIGTVHKGLQGLVWRACELASEGASLPKGLRWVERSGRRPIAEPMTGRFTTREQVRWALLVVDGHPGETPSCPCCGRPL